MKFKPDRYGLLTINYKGDLLSLERHTHVGFGASPNEARDNLMGVE